MSAARSAGKALFPTALRGSVTLAPADGGHRSRRWHQALLLRGDPEALERGVLQEFKDAALDRDQVVVHGARRADAADTAAEGAVGAVVDAFEEVKKHPFDDAWHRSRSADLSKVKTPLLTCANWGGQGIHPRGNFNGFTETPADTPKWLEGHGDSHWSVFSNGYGVALQKRFFDYWLKGEQNGWDRQPRVQLNVRHPGEKFVLRHENEWPIARTQWTRLYLDAANNSLTTSAPAEAGAAFKALDSEGITFSTPPLEKETEITGPVAVKLFVSSSTSDADIFVILRVFRPDDSEVVFKGAVDPHTPVAHGWLRASHRKLDKILSTAWRPYHSHDEIQPLVPGDVYELDIEVWPTSIVIRKGHKLRVDVQPRDGVGSAPYTHYHAEYNAGATNTIYAGGDKPSYIMLPVIPAK